MSDYDLLIQFLKILTLFGGISIALFLLWRKNYLSPALATDRRQMNMQVDVDRRKGERRRQPRRMAYPA